MCVYRLTERFLVKLILCNIILHIQIQGLLVVAIILHKRRLYRRLCMFWTHHSNYARRVEV